MEMKTESESAGHQPRHFTRVQAFAGMFTDGRCAEINTDKKNRKTDDDKKSAD